MEILRHKFPIACAALALSVAAGVPNLLAADGATTVQATVDRESAYAAFLLNLIRFVRWPEGAFKSKEDPIVIGTLRQDPLGETLERFVRDETVDARRISVVRVRTLEDLNQCHAVFVSHTEPKRLSALLGHIRGKPVLAVSDLPGFVELGGHVMLDVSLQRVHLRVSVANLNTSHLSASAQLLRLSEIVEP
jgi:hypothetical protein